MLFVVINYFFEMVFNRLFNLQTLFFLVSLIYLYPKVINDRKKYFIILFVSGFIYDITITNIISINSLLFLLIGYINTIYNQNFNDKLINNVIFLNLMLILYHILLYIFFVMVEISSFSICKCFNALLLILLINSIYYVLLFIFVKKIKR